MAQRWRRRPKGKPVLASNANAMKTPVKPTAAQPSARDPSHSAHDPPSSASAVPDQQAAAKKNRPRRKKRRALISEETGPSSQPAGSAQARKKDLLPSRSRPALSQFDTTAPSELSADVTMSAFKKPTFRPTGASNIVHIDYNTDKRGKVQQASIQNKIGFRARVEYHPRVGVSRKQYADEVAHALDTIRFAPHMTGNFDNHILDAIHFYQSVVIEEAWKQTAPQAYHVMWPHNGSKTTSVASMRTSATWDKPAVQQKTKLFEVLDILPLVSDFLVREGHYTLGALGASCQEAFSFVAKQFELWDMTLGRFNGANLDNSQLRAGGNSSGRGGKAVRVTPVRYFVDDFLHVPARPMGKDKNKVRASTTEDDIAHIKATEEWYGISQKTWFGGLTELRPEDKRLPLAIVCQTPYERQAENLGRFYKALKLGGRFLSVLHLHRVPLLDVRGIRIVLDAAPQLDMLGVYACELVHFGHVVTLVDLVHDHNVRNDRKGDDGLQLDFAPRYHQGPMVNARATYGVTWNNNHSAPIQVGVFQVATLAAVKAEGMGIDLLSRGKAFRRYMERIPLHKFSVAHWVDSLLWWIEVAGWSTRQAVDGQEPPLSPQELDQFANDFISVVIRGLDQIPRGVPNSMKTAPSDFESYRQKDYCSSCDLSQLSVFFNRAHGVCAGCVLRKVLDKETNHNKAKKRALLDGIYGGKQSNWRGTHVVRAPLIDNPIMASGIVGDVLQRHAQRHGIRASSHLMYHDNMEVGLTIDNVASDESALTRHFAEASINAPSANLWARTTRIGPHASWEERQLPIAADYTSWSINDVDVDPDIGPFPDDGAKFLDSLSERMCVRGSYGAHAQLSLQALVRRQKEQAGEVLLDSWYRV